VGFARWSCLWHWGRPTAARAKARAERASVGRRNAAETSLTGRKSQHLLELGAARVAAKRNKWFVCEGEGYHNQRGELRRWKEVGIARLYCGRIKVQKIEELDKKEASNYLLKQLKMASSSNSFRALS